MERELEALFALTDSDLKLKSSLFGLLLLLEMSICIPFGPALDLLELLEERDKLEVLELNEYRGPVGTLGLLAFVAFCFPIFDSKSSIFLFLNNFRDLQDKYG